MTVTLPAELEHAIQQRAQQKQTTIEHLVREAVAWYLQMDVATIDELEAWQEVRDEALRLVEEPAA